LGSGPYFYFKAEECLAKGEYWRAETFFENAGNYSDAEERSLEYFAEQYADEGNIPEVYRQMVGIYGETNALKKTYQLLYRRVGYGDIALENDDVFGIKANGTIVSRGPAAGTKKFKNQWKNVIAISSGYSHSIGLKSDGTVAAHGDNSNNQCDVSGWTDIVAISAGYYHTVGLKADGTVVATGQNTYNQCDVGSWKNVIAVFSGDDYTVGLCRDGSLLYTGHNADREAKLSSWQHVTNLSAGSKYTVGMTAKGESMVYSTDQKTVEKWTDLAYVSSTGDFAVGLKRDGTVVAAGDNQFGQCNVSEWKDVVYITTNSYSTLGLKSNGTLVFTGGPIKSFNVSSWQNIGCTKTLD
jgi:alpha-tubulin suppressor-like RCC1 family protein